MPPAALSGPRSTAWEGTSSGTTFTGWSPRYVPDSLLREAATRLQDRFLFGSDYPFITPQRWLKDFEAIKIEFKPEVKEKLFWKNGQKLLAHTAVGSMHFSS
jgi:predicted TIM-barrel fold metal-dependent hydrolase